MKATGGRRWIVSGRVQGVGYRYFVQHKAASLGLQGWARNLQDGSVEVYATGEQARLNDLAAALHVGPPYADVRHVEQQEATPQSFAGFSIR